MIVVTQSPTSLEPKIRSQFDHIIMFGNKSEEYIRQLYNCYDKTYKTFDEFVEKFDNVTKDYGCMIIKNGIELDQESTFKLIN